MQKAKTCSVCGGARHCYEDFHQQKNFCMACLPNAIADVAAYAYVGSGAARMDDCAGLCVGGKIKKINALAENIQNKFNGGFGYAKIDR